MPCGGKGLVKVAQCVYIAFACMHLVILTVVMSSATTTCAGRIKFMKPEKTGGFFFQFVFFQFLFIPLIHFVAQLKSMLK